MCLRSLCVVFALLNCREEETAWNAPLKSSTAEIYSFVINAPVWAEGVINEESIIVPVPKGTARDAMTAFIELSEGARCDTNPEEPADYSSPRRCTVRAEDGTTRVYLVEVIDALEDSKEITAFSIDGTRGQIYEDAGIIIVTLPFGSALTGRAASAQHTGVLIQPSPLLPRSYEEPVDFTVTSENKTVKTYTVTALVAPVDAKDITRFTIPGQTSSAVDEAEGTISVTLPYGSSKAALTPELIHTGKTISPDTESARNFTSPVVYTVSAADGSTKKYVVTVVVAPPVSVLFRAVTADGAPEKTDTTTLTLEFSAELPGLDAGSIQLMPAGGISKSGFLRKKPGRPAAYALGVYGIASNRLEVAVRVASPAGYTVMPPAQTVTVWKKSP